MATREEITEQALALSPEDRAYVAAELARSIIQEAAEAGEKSSPEALLKELQRRSTAYRAGQTPSKPAAQLIAELRATGRGDSTP